jgi:hypothetical protein
VAESTSIEARECYWCARARGHDVECPGQRPQPSHEPVIDWVPLQPNEELARAAEEMRSRIQSRWGIPLGPISYKPSMSLYCEGE